MAETITESKMTEFGQYLFGLMLQRGIEYKGDLADMLAEGGYSMSRSRLSHYLGGRRLVPWVFVCCVEEVLKLSQSERKKLENLHIDEYLRTHTRLTDEESQIVENFRARL